MSATLDGARFSALMHDAPVIESEGRSWPLDLRHIGRAAEKRIEDDMAAAIRHALEEECGRSEEHTSELQSLMRISYAVFCLKKKTNENTTSNITQNHQHSTIKLI